MPVHPILEDAAMTLGLRRASSCREAATQQAPTLVSQHPRLSQLHTAHTPLRIPDDGLCIYES
jgi:hypothetical protein